MRNLKKILALVLALIMSLSLMATAGATDFKDDENVSDTYRVAVEVLSDLGVFNGDQNGQFNPEQPITRAEVAAIIYRIATGDVTNERNGSYAPYNQFPDIMEGDWYAGYVTYCANAGYVKGRNTGKFDPKDNVTGYEVLAMILRAVGYDKNNEFVGSNWQTNTASLATQKGVLKNITSATSLGAPATRETVAELLFRSILLNQVNWNSATLSYDDNRETLAKENLGMESVTGVIMANEWANINEKGVKVLDEGKTQLKPEGETKNLTLDISTELDAVGLSYSAYIQNGTKVLGELEYCDDLNTDVSNEGAKASVGALLKKGDLTLGKDAAETEYFLDYNEDFTAWYESDYLIRYAIAVADAKNNGVEDYITGLEKTDGTKGTDPVDGHTYEIRNITIDGKSTECYVVAIRPGNPIIDEDIFVMKGIFYTADRLGETTVAGTDRDFVTGEVYVGTNSYVDVSDWNGNDTLSWKQFVEKYLLDDGQYNYTGCENGESLRVIDNNGDGVADYIFKVQYWQDKAIDTEKDTLLFYELDLGDYWFETFVDEIAVGDVVNYTSIDGRVTVYKADMITGKVTEKNFEKTTILTTANDTVYGQSEIFNNTFMDDRILQTEDGTEYNFYLDEYNYIRTYERTSGSRYALVTEMYNTTNQAYNYVTNNRYIAEVKAGEEKIDEYVVANPVNNPFISAYAWTSRIANQYVQSEVNYLQPAIAHLGISAVAAPKTALTFLGATTNNVAAYDWRGTGSWNRGVFEMVPDTNTTNYGVFDYGKVAGRYYDEYVGGIKNENPDDPVNHSFSFTNVANYSFGENDTVSLYSASKLKADKNGKQMFYWQDVAGYNWQGLNQAKDPIRGIGRTQMNEADWRAAYAKSNNLTDTAAKDKAAIDAAVAACLVEVYEVDYVQLQKEALTANKRHFYIAEDYTSKYSALSNGYVNATVDTEFYIAMPNDVLYYVGYDKLPTIKAENIRAAYAVATNKYEDASANAYWIANVIVIEVYQLDNPYDSISLMYFNPNEVSGSVRNLRSLNNMWRTYQPDSEDEAKINVVPKLTTGANAGSYTWGNTSWTSSSYGFYEVYDSTYADGTITAGDVQKLTLGATDWASKHIYAGTIQRIWGLNESEYIDVDYLGRTIPENGKFINDINVKSVTVTSGDLQVPIYRVNGTSTSDLRLGKRVQSSDIKLGDQLILVYDKTGTALSYIVDLGYRYYGPNSAYDPANTTGLRWLWDTYLDIVDRQDVTVNSQTTTLAFNLALGAGETASIIYNDEVQGNYGYVAAGIQIATLKVPSNSAIITFQVKLGGGASPFAVVPNAPWACYGSPVWNATTNTMTVKLLNTSVSNASAKAAMLLDSENAGTLFTVKGLQAYADNIAANADDMEAEELAVAKAVLAGAKATGNQPVNSSTGAAINPSDAGKISAAESAISDALAEQLPDVKAAAKKEVDAYESAKIALLSDVTPTGGKSPATLAAEALTKANSDITSAADAAAVEAAVKAYKKTIDELVKNLTVTDASKEAAKTEINTAASTAESTLTGDALNSALLAKDAAFKAIESATTVDQLTSAIDAYKAEIKKLMTVTVTFSGANVTVKVDNKAVTSTSATAGEDVEFTVTAADGYALVDVKNGETVLTETAGKYTVTPTANTTITITTRKMEGVSVTVVNPNGSTVPSHLTVTPNVAEAALLSLVKLTLKADDGYALPSALSAVMVNGKQFDLDSSNGCKYTAGTGAVEFVGDKSAIVLEGSIVIYAAAVAKAGTLTVANPADGTITDPTLGTGESVKYAVVSSNPATALGNLTVLSDESAANTAISDTLAAKGSITLTASDNDKYLVAVVLKDGKVVKAGSVKIAYNKAAALTVANPANGTVTVPTDLGTGVTIQYGVTSNKTAPNLSAITVMDAASAVATAAGVTLQNAGTAPTLTAASNGEYLVAVTVRDSKVVAVGSVKIDFAKPTEITTGISVANDGTITASATTTGNSLVYKVYETETAAKAATDTWTVMTAASGLSATDLTSGTTKLAAANAGKYLVVVEVNTAGNVVAFGGCTTPETITA